MTNRNFILLNISYGMSINVFYCLSTFLNQVKLYFTEIIIVIFNLIVMIVIFKLVLLYYPGHEIDAGQIGLSMVLGGMIGALICGIILDRTHRYK